MPTFPQCNPPRGSRRVQSDRWKIGLRGSTDDADHAVALLLDFMLEVDAENLKQDDESCHHHAPSPPNLRAGRAGLNRLTTFLPARRVILDAHTPLYLRCRRRLCLPMDKGNSAQVRHFRER